MATVEASPVRLSVERLIAELRAAKVFISTGAAIDAVNAVQVVDIGKPQEVKAALRATLISDQFNLELFEATFRRVFSTVVARDDTVFDVSASELGRPDFVELLKEALLSGDPSALKEAAKQTVDSYAPNLTDPALGSNYHYFKALAQVDLDAVVGELESNPATDRNTQVFRDNVAAEIRRRLRRQQALDGVKSSDDRTLSGPSKAIDQIDFLYASSKDLELLRAQVQTIGVKLAAKLRRRQSRQQRKLDLRRTLRRSVATGGVPVRLFYSSRQKRKPKLVVLADLSGSVASFARFTLNLVHVLSSEFSTVRTFGFVDELDEITDLFSSDFDLTAQRIASEARVLGEDRHSNYGKVLDQFTREYPTAITPSTTVLILGDARNNYHDSNSDTLAEIADKSKQVHWLNPESKEHWGTGDSVINDYRQVVASVHEVRNLRQLQRFIETV